MKLLHFLALTSILAMVIGIAGLIFDAHADRFWSYFYGFLSGVGVTALSVAKVILLCRKEVKK